MFSPETHLLDQNIVKYRLLDIYLVATPSIIGI